MGILEDAATAYQQAVAAVSAPFVSWSGNSNADPRQAVWDRQYAEDQYAATWRNVNNLSNFSAGAGAISKPAKDPNNPPPPPNSLNPDGTSKYATIRQADGSYAPPTRAQGGLSPTFATNPNTAMLGDPYYAKAEESVRYRGDTPNALGVLQYNPNNYAPIESVYALSQPTPGNVSSRTDVASNIQSILNPTTGLYSANPNYRPAYNPTTQPYGGSAFNMATEMAGKGTLDPRVMGIANYQGYGEYRNGAPVPRASVGGGGGTSYDMAMMLERSGGQIGAELLQRAKEQGYVPSAERPLNVVESKSTVPIWDLSSGMAGKNVPMGWVPPDNRTFMPLGALAAQQREGTKITYSPGGGFNVNQLIPSTQSGFTRIYPMITGGGSDYALQSGMVAGKALTPQVYDQYGLNALWTPDKASLIAEMQVHPERFSRQGAELYGGKVERLDNRTMQDEFTKGTVSTMPGRYAPETMNYAMLPGLLSPNTPKQFTGTDKLPSGASPTFASDPIFQIVDVKTGEIKGVTPNWEPVKQNVVPKEQPEFIMVRPDDIARTYTPVQPVQVSKYQPQIGGFIINAPPSFNMTQEVKEKAAYDANAAMMWADRQNKETFKSQTWMEPQPWQLVKNPLYQTPEQKAGAAPVTFMGMNVVSLEKAQPSGMPIVAAPSQVAASMEAAGYQVLGNRVGITPTSPMGVEVGMAEGSIPKPFSSVGTTYEAPKGEILGYTIPALSPLVAFFQQGKSTTSKDVISKIPDVTTFVGSTYAPVAGGIERTDTYETTGGTKTTTNTIERSTPSAYETFIAPYRAAEKSVGEAIPISVEQGEAALRIVQTGNFLTTPQMIPRYTLEAGKALGLPVTQEQINVARAGEPLTGQFAAFKESPLLTTASYATGYVLGGVTRGAGSVYSTVARVPMADAAIAGEVIPATGVTYRTALQYSDWLTTKAIPAALTVLYSGDIAARSTEGFTRFDTGSVEKAKGIVGQEAIPMVLGMGAGYRVPEAILGTPRTTITSYRPTDTTQIATGGMFEQGRVGIDPAQVASGGQFRSVPSTGEVITERVVTREGGLFGEGGTSSQMKSVAATVREALDFTPQKMIERMSTRGEYTTPLEFREGAIVQSKERLYNDNPDGTPRYRQQFTQEPTAYPKEQSKVEMVRLYRGEGKPVENVNSWISDQMPASQKEAQGRWFTESLADANWYKSDAGVGGRITYVDVPKSVAEQYRVSNLPPTAEARNFPSGRASANGGMTTQEFFVSRDIASTAQPLSNQKLSLIEKVLAVTTGATARMQSAYPTSPADTRFGMNVIEYPRTTIIPAARAVSEPITFDSRVALDMPVRPLAPEATTTSFTSALTEPKFGVAMYQARPTVKAYSTALDEMNTFATTKANTISAAQAIPSAQSKVMADASARYTVIEDVGSRSGVFSFPMVTNIGLSSIQSRALELQRSTATSQFITTPAVTNQSRVTEMPYTATDTRIQRNPIITPVPIILPPLWGGSGGGSFGSAKPQGRARVTDIFRYGQGIGSFGSVTPINFGKSMNRKGKR